MQGKHRKLVEAALVGAGLGFVHNTFPGDGTAKLQILVFYLAIFPLAVLLASRPLSRYGQGIATATVAVLAWTAVKFITEALSQTYFETTKMVWLFWGFYGFIGLSANIAFGTVATMLRRRLYPIYPIGHCHKCGYDLTGNESGRCPECGDAT